jgi:hypothetical protein
MKRPRFTKPIFATTPTGKGMTFYNTTQAAQYLNVSPQTIKKCCQSGNPDKHGNTYRYI